MGINKQEFKYILFSGIFALVWYIFLLPFLVKTFDGNSPVFQFFIFNLGLFIFFVLFLKAITTNVGFNIKNSIGLICLFLSLDIFMPEYHVAITGELIKGADLGVSTTDYFFGYLAQNTFHLSGILVYLFTYFLAPVVLLIIASKVLPNFVKHV